ncbi:MAG: HD domain-containing protein [candidate division WOR-3 bacterium]|nr:HD domain-containing protein [candidate division WOR-3 bacterium]
MNFQRTSLKSVLQYLNEFARSFQKEIKVHCLSIYVYDRDTKVFHTLSHFGSDACMRKVKTLRLGDDVPVAVIRRKTPLLLSKQKNFKFLSNNRGEVLLIPFTIKRNPVGFLFIHFSKKVLSLKRLSTIEERLYFLKAFLHNYVALKKMTGEVTGLKMLDEINKIVATELNPERLYNKMYEQVKRIVRVKNLRIDLYEPDKQNFKTVFFIHEGKRLITHPVINLHSSRVFSEIYRRRHVMLTSEYRKYIKSFDRNKLSPAMDVASFVALPLLVRNNFLGVVLCWDRYKKNIFTSRVVRFLKLMSAQSAIAIYNARLFEQLNRAINDLTLLYQIEYHISSILSKEELLATAVQLIDSALGNLITTILLPDENEEKLVIRAISPGAKIKSGFETVPFFRGIVGAAMQTKKLVYVPDVEKDERYVPAIEGIKSEVAIPLVSGTKLLGVIDFQSKVKDRFDLMTLDLLDDIAHRIAVFLENAILYEKIEKSYSETIRALVLAMEVKDSYTRGHSERVTELAIKLADRIGLTDGKKKLLYWAGLLHDIGKIGISESILNKPGTLDEFEFSEIKRHPVEGARMLEQIEGLKEVVPIIKHHHENYDGTGYPEGLKGEEIPLESRVLAVCDVYDAMTTVRSYRKPYSREGALMTIESFSGTRLDPNIVKEFLEMMRTKKEDT